jgi:putative hydrolase of HD superfamily
LAKRYGLAGADVEAVVSDQINDMPPRLAATLTAVATEYEAQESLEARCAWDADKLECMVQAIEYRAQGHQAAQRWIDNSHARLRTEAARALAGELLAHEPSEWLRKANGDA